MRVAGAQMLAGPLGLDLYFTQLVGRWGSQAVARYVQDAPIIFGVCTSRPRSLRQIVECTEGDNTQGEISDLKQAVAEIKKTLETAHHEALDHAVQCEKPAHVNEIVVYSDSS